MEQTCAEVEAFEVDDQSFQDITFEVMEDELLAINKPTVQLYGN